MSYGYAGIAHSQQKRDRQLLGARVRPVLERIGVIVNVVTPTRERVCVEKVLERSASVRKLRWPGKSLLMGTNIRR